MLGTNHDQCKYCHHLQHHNSYAKNNKKLHNNYKNYHYKNKNQYPGNLQ